MYRLNSSLHFNPQTAPFSVSQRLIMLYVHI